MDSFWYFGKNAVPLFTNDMKELELNWYAVKVFFNKVFELEEKLESMGLESYIAVQKVQLKGIRHLQAVKKLAQAEQEGHSQDRRFFQEGAILYERVPLVKSLLFVRADANRILEVDALLKPVADASSAKGFIYKTTDWKTFAVIPAKQMEMFRLVTGAGLGGLEFFADDDFTRFKQGDRVRVIDGPLRGAEGYIKRIRKNRRLLVSIEGVIAVATSYIPPQNLQIVPEA